MWAYPNRSNLGAERSEGRDHRVPKAEVPLKLDTCQVSQTTWRPVQLSSDIRETENDHPEDLDDDGMKNFSSNSDQQRKEGQVDKLSSFN